MAHQITDQFVRVALDIPLGCLDYRLDESVSAVVGDRVIVPLGTRKMVGVITEIHSHSDIEAKKLRKVIKVLTETEPLKDEWLKLTHFAADYYVRTWGEAALPSLPKFFREIPRARHELSLQRIREVKKSKVQATAAPEMNQEQREAFNAIVQAKGFAPIVLFGVTGSGKTEVYLHAMQEVLAQDPEAQVLLLVPEINLTPQLEKRVRERFGDELVVTLHSSLTDSERARHWLAVHEGRSRVLVGTRLAVFSSFKKLSLVIVDEEHDASYKAGDGLRFSARDLALKRAQQNAIPCVLGSATPSLETWAKVRSGAYRCLRLQSRAVVTAKLPQLTLVDVSKKRPDVFDETVKEAISNTIARGEQVLVFINRRGYAPVISCASCGWVSRCVHCSGFTVFHKKEARLVCHHCGTTYAVPQACPTCGNVDIEPIGTGTQKIEEALTRFWPNARILRIDRDSIRAKNEAENAFKSIHAGEVDIIVGTQMISKGHDFQNVGLVVVLNADAQLVSPDLRAEERLFATLMQVAGRAGRANTKGQVLIQTRFANHPLYAALCTQNYEAFADRLLAERQESFSPPFTFQALLFAQSTLLARALNFLVTCSEKAKALGYDAVQIYDPVPMNLMRLMDIERAQLLVEAQSRSELHHFLKQWLKSIEPEQGVDWLIEVDPMDI